MSVLSRNGGLCCRNAASLLIRSKQQSSSFSTTSMISASAFKMPSMSPTMEVGSISSWKVKEGEKYSAGDILLSIETDKAEVDVEAQDDGFLGKIFKGDGASGIAVGETIAAIGEDANDDYSSIEPGTSASAAPEKPSTPAPESSTSASSPSSSTPSESSSPKSDVHPHHSRPLFPSVLLLLERNGVQDATKIKGTGLRGMLTKGDVLAYLGKVNNPFGSASKLKPISNIPENLEKPKERVLREPTGAELAQFITMGLASPKVPVAEEKEPVTFDSVLDDYFPARQPSQPKPASADSLKNVVTPKADPYDALLGL